MTLAAEGKVVRVPTAPEAPALAGAAVLTETAEGSESARTAGSASPLQAGERLGDRLNVIVRAHDSILHAT